MRGTGHAGGVSVVGLLVVAVLVAAADQATKRAVVRRLAPGQRRQLPGGLALAHVTNPRGGIVALPVWVAVGVAVVGTGVAVSLALDPTVPGATVVGFGLVIGGMVGNVADRVRLGAVVDVLSLWGWRVANLADAALVVGALVVAASLVLVPA